MTKRTAQPTVYRIVVNDVYLTLKRKPGNKAAWIKAWHRVVEQRATAERTSRIQLVSDGAHGRTVVRDNRTGR